MLLIEGGVYKEVTEEGITELDEFAGREAVQASVAITQSSENPGDTSETEEYEGE